MKFKLFALIHQLAVGSVGLGLAAAEAVQHSPALQAAVLATGVSPGMLTAVGAAVGTVTHLVDKRAKDRLAQAIINDPTLPTPQLLGLPAPQLKEG